MRAALWLIGLFAAAVALALFAGGNQGTVSIFWPPYRMDWSLNLILLLLVVGFLLVHLALRAVAAALELPRQARRWRAQQRERATHAALLDAQAQYSAGRYLRARKLAEAALAREQALEEAGEAATHGGGVRVLAHMLVAESAHALQDHATRDEQLVQALAQAEAPGMGPEWREGVLLRAARWSLNQQDAAGALARLDELPAGALRRTAALRLKLKAARQSGHMGEALETARLLAKHGAFSPAAAHSLIRGLVADLLAQTQDPEQLRGVWRALDDSERAMPELALRAAQRLAALGGDQALVRQWLAPVWHEIQVAPGTLGEPQRLRLVRALEAGMVATGDETDQAWLAQVEAAQRANPRDAGLQYLTGMACLHRGLWGRAQMLLGQAARNLNDAVLRRKAWCALAKLAEQQGDEAAAAAAWKQAALH